MRKKEGALLPAILVTPPAQTHDTPHTHIQTHTDTHTHTHTHRSLPPAGQVARPGVNHVEVDVCGTPGWVAAEELF